MLALSCSLSLSVLTMVTLWYFDLISVCSYCGITISINLVSHIQGWGFYRWGQWGGDGRMKRTHITGQDLSSVHEIIDLPGPQDNKKLYVMSFIFQKEKNWDLQRLAQLHMQWSPCNYEARILNHNLLSFKTQHSGRQATAHPIWQTLRLLMSYDWSVNKWEQVCFLHQRVIRQDPPEVHL